MRGQVSIVTTLSHTLSMAVVAETHVAVPAQARESWPIRANWALREAGPECSVQTEDESRCCSDLKKAQYADISARLSKITSITSDNLMYRTHM